MFLIRLGLRGSELVGLLLRILGATSWGLGLSFACWVGVRPLYYRDAAFALQATDGGLFLVFFGLGAVLWTFGSVELRGLLPARLARERIEAERFLNDHCTKRR